MSEAQQSVAEIFSAAKWTAGDKDGWNGSFIWSDASVIGGIDPWGTPRVTVVGVRSPEEAAAWLVQHAIDLRLAPALEPEESAAHEDDEETGAEAGSIQMEVEVVRDGPAGDDFSNGESHQSFDDARDSLGAEILDADYSEPIDLLVEGSDFADVALEPDGPSAFIFGDNLDQKRTSAIGLVVQSALLRMPEAIDYARMAELRNFTMGVSEGRWPDDPDKREELDTLEATERLRRAVEACRDAKVAALLNATREEIEAFDVESDWP